MKVVIASDKFKGSLSSEQVAAAIEEGILAAMPDCEIDKLHVADGGDGTAASIVESTGGVWINVKSEDPLGRPVDARFGAVESRTAVIDVATASGIALLRPDEYDPLNATTKGTGILIREAIDRGFRNFNIGVGGSATNDAGTGLLSALGYRFLDARGNELEPCGRSLSRIAEIDDSQRMPELKECSFTVMCDVDAAFYGPKGAAWLFGPQKGATNKILEALDDGMRTFAAVVKKKYGKSMQNQSYAGAAGGIGGALWAMLDASLTPGIYAMLKAINFEASPMPTLWLPERGRWIRSRCWAKLPTECVERLRGMAFRRLHSWEACQTAVASMSTDSCRFIQRFPALCRSKRR